MRRCVAACVRIYVLYVAYTDLPTLPNYLPILTYIRANARTLMHVYT